MNRILENVALQLFRGYWGFTRKFGWIAKAKRKTTLIIGCMIPKMMYKPWIIRRTKGLETLYYFPYSGEGLFAKCNVIRRMINNKPIKPKDVSKVKPCLKPQEMRAGVEDIVQWWNVINREEYKNYKREEIIFLDKESWILRYYFQTKKF